MISSGWTNFWAGQKQSFNTIMKINTTFFALRMEKLFHLKPTDEILDYGCGPGFLADHLAAKKISITGADINKYFIEYSRANHPESLFIQVTPDTEINKKLLDEQLKGKKFDYIILLSIAQYFKNAEELENVIRLLFSYKKKKGKIIIADVIDENTSSLADALSLLRHCVKKGMILAFIRFMVYLLFSNYSRISRKTKLLRISEQSISRIAANNLLDFEKINGLTIHSSRTSYVLTNTSHYYRGN